jgi:exopolysaccharide biosynthesis polyprenyl glycosylphosphotransferase
MKRDWALVFRRLMPILDLVLVIVAFALAYFLRYNLQIIRQIRGEAFYAPFEVFLPYVFVYAAWLLITYPVAGLYREQRGRSWLEEVYRIVNGVMNATVLTMAISFLLQPLFFSRLMIILASAFVVILLSLERLVYRAVRAYLRRRGIAVERVLLVGAGEAGRAVLSAIIAREDLGYRPIGYVDDNPERGTQPMGRINGLGGLDKLPKLIAERAADTVIIALPWSARDKIMQIVAECERHGVASRVVPDVLQLNLSQVQFEFLDGIPLLGLKAETRIDRSKTLIKRALDLSLVLLSLPVVIPIVTVIAIAVKLDSPGPILFGHKRVGKDGREFRMWKFRSMVDGADKMRNQLVRQTGVDARRPKWADDPRVTRVGKLLRRTSLDEIPNIINVIRGEMSIVGPRPPTPSEVALYEPWQRQRLNTEPGLTCLWQVSGRSKIPFEEQCLLDIYYIQNWSIRLDLQILLRTIPNVLIGNGAY